MAPTVCSEKKVRVAGMKEARRRGNMGVAQSTTNTSTAVTAATQAAAAGAIQNSVVLNYVAKGSTHSAGRQQRRRMVRVPSRLQHISKNIISSSTSSSSSESEQQLERMELDEYTNSDYNEATSIQISRTHSSGSSNNNINIKTVLQPTTANSNSNNYIFGNGGNNNKTSTTAKFCDQMPSADDEDDDDDDDEEEDQGDGDSGYEFALEPIKPHIQQQYHSHNEGLLSIALKTIKLVQRNKLLQKRLAQLQLETSEFIASVLANPENRHFRDKVAVKAESPSKVSNVLLRH
ncbi:uncharacterized protein DDB_G0281497 [Drosophila albomicans]|uniref:Uncharacterized protein DDB_G0281497 n=1 Tax=Drosophila albomicans TaxID=7291 RepID=A0A6P8XND2_DROAB|nr:uncharacterized protein DDB_G0281497 [Drosophila albomicans]